MNKIIVFLTLLLMTFYANPARAENADVMIVFDGSGSMWGQIEGRAKIEIARETLSSVLSEANADMNIGMIAYGHRKKGQCSDIQTVVPVGPATRTIPAIISAANAILPKGKTPLSDAVRMAAEELKFTENAATVVLVTDGIETCNADPCALANELERLGLNFTTHVVGFDLSKEEGRQVACLAHNTGGNFYEADKASDLADALLDAISFEGDFVEDDFSDDDFVDEEPTSQTRNVEFSFRDVQGGPLLTARQLSLSFYSELGLQPEGDTFYTHFDRDYSASGRFPAGKYTALITREDQAGYKVSYDFEIAAGEGIQRVDAMLAGYLEIDVLINKYTPYDYAAPPIASVKDYAYVYLDIFQLVEGQPAEEAIISTSNPVADSLPAGEYLVRGTIDRTTTVEMSVEVKADVPTKIDFDFAVTKVFFDATQADGSPVARQTTYLYDQVPSGSNYWRKGYGRIYSDDSVTPFYLPDGLWVVDVGGEGKGGRRSQIGVDVSSDYEDILVRVGEGERLSDSQKSFINSDSYAGCEQFVGAGHKGCFAGGPRDIETEQFVDPEQQDMQTSDTAVYSFVDANGAVQVALSFRQGEPLGLLTLHENWCGQRDCVQDETDISQAVQEIIDGKIAKAIGDPRGRYDLRFSHIGDQTYLIFTGNEIAGSPRAQLILKAGGSVSSVENKNRTASSSEPLLPVGIFTFVGLEPGQAGFGDAGAQNCATNPSVIYPDNMMAQKSVGAPINDNPYQTVGHGLCRRDSASQNIFCDLSRGEIGTTGGETQSMEIAVTPLDEGHYKSCNHQGGDCFTLYACIRPGGEFDATLTLPNGVRAVDAIIARPDGGPVFTYDDNNQLKLSN